MSGQLTEVHVTPLASRWGGGWPSPITLLGGAGFFVNIFPRTPAPTPAQFARGFFFGLPSRLRAPESPPSGESLAYARLAPTIRVVARAVKKMQYCEPALAISICGVHNLWHRRWCGWWLPPYMFADCPPSICVSHGFASDHRYSLHVSDYSLHLYIHINRYIRSKG